MSTQIQTAPAPPAKPNRPRVIWLRNTADHYFVQMVDALNAQGDLEYFCVFLCPPLAGNVIYQTPQNAPFILLGSPNQPMRQGSRKYSGASARAFIKNLEFSAAIVGGYDSHFKRWTLRYCQSRGIPTAMFADSNIRADRGKSLKHRLKRLVKRIFLRRVIQNLDWVIPFNRSGVAYWRYYGFPAQGIIQSTCLCTVNADVALAGDRRELFARYGLDPGIKLIFTAARLVPVKALHLMLRAFKESKLAEHGWVWAVAGDGPLRRRLEQQAGELNIKAIRFLGPVKPEDIPLLMAQSELFVLPSTYEPHGIAVTEAMAVGTPVIASDCCGSARDLVRNGETGWSFKNGDAKDLRRVLEPAATGLERLRSMRPTCRDKFQKWYDAYGPLVVVPRVVMTNLRRNS